MTAWGFTATREVREIDVLLLRMPGELGPWLARSRVASMRDGRSRMSHGVTSLSMVGMPMSLLVRDLEAKLGRPIVNETGLDGLVDAELSAESGEPDAIIGAVRDQLGLQLVEAPREIERLVLHPARPAPVRH